jgi:membrane protease YdiL (CAAX protease family)
LVDDWIADLERAVFSFAWRGAALILMPPVLFLSMLVAFTAAEAVFGPRLGYYAGFVFYWAVWCVLFPLLLLGHERVMALFRPPVGGAALGRPAWVGLAALLLPPLVGFGLVFPPAATNATLQLIVASALIGFINGIGEEVLWRGLYAEVFPGRVILGYLYPTLGFAAWHFVPLILFPNTHPGGRVAYVAAVAIWGLCYGWVAWRSGSIRWTSVSHTVLGFSWLSGRVYVG